MADQLVRDSIDVWQSSAADDKVRELSHWLGHGMWKDEERWLGIGQRARQRLDELKRYCNARPGPYGRVMEWGSGGGAIAVELAKTADAYYGVDISRENLAECERQMRARSLVNFHPVHIAEDPWAAGEGLEDSLDVFLSIAVFQHFPGKEYGAEVLRVVRKMLKKNGFGFVQIRYDDGEEKFRPKTENYRDNFVYFTSYAIPEFWELLKAVGLRPMYLGHFNVQTHYVSFAFRG